MSITATQTSAPSRHRLKEIGGDSVITISSAKSGNGVDQLRDNDLTTFWQSDGGAPHLINIQFIKKVSVCSVCLYMDYTIDESYTAKKISIRSGNTHHDLYDINSLELNEPNGWVHVSLMDAEDKPLRTHFLQIRILGMHQNGRDTHIRQLCVYGPNTSNELHGQFRTPEMLQFGTVR